MVVSILCRGVNGFQTRLHIDWRRACTTVARNYVKRVQTGSVEKLSGVLKGSVGCTVRSRSYGVFYWSSLPWLRREFGDGRFWKCGGEAMGMFGGTVRGLATNRQRMKTPSCLKRRFKKTGTGQFIRYSAGFSHKLSKKNKRRKRYGRQSHPVPKSFAKLLRKLNFKRR